MQFDPNNKIVKICAEGMRFEGEGKKEEALELFLQAWNEASNDVEKLTAAHYVARHQKSVADKLKWDTAALDLALKLEDERIKSVLPSLYLNVGKCYEDLSDFSKAALNYELALSWTNFLPADGYGNMVKAGINNGITRIHRER